MKIKDFIFVMSVLFPTVASSQLKVQSDAKVGIGTLTPRYDLDIVTRGETKDTIMIGKKDHGNKLMVEMDYASPGGMGRQGYSAIKLSSMAYPYNTSLGSSDRRWGSIYLMYSPNVASDERLKGEHKGFAPRYLD